MALIGSLAMTEIYAQQTIVACNGKTYKQGDTLVVGKPASSGYYICGQLTDKEV